MDVYLNLHLVFVSKSPSSVCMLHVLSISNLHVSKCVCYMCQHVCYMYDVYLVSMQASVYVKCASIMSIHTQSALVCM
jgi:hypothetical protein